MNSKLRQYAKDILLTGLCLLLVWQWLRPNSGPKLGSSAIQFDLPLASGNGRFRLADQRGHPLVIEVFASWCGSCRQSAPALAAAWGKYKDQGVAFVAVSVDETPAAALSAAQSWPIPYAVALDDGSVSRAFGISAVPTVVVVDREGKVQHVSTGSPSVAELDRLLMKL